MEWWTLVSAHFSSRMCLERQTREGESPVREEKRRDWGYPEYRALDIAREAGRYRLPILNTSRDR